MNISVVIPNYNGEVILEKNIPRVLNTLSLYKGGKKELIIVDDASQDNSMKVLEQLSDQFSSTDLSFKIFRNKSNKGFSTTVNTGVSEASNEIIILFNSDIVPENDFLEPLLTHFSNDRVFAVGCMDKSIERDKVVLRGRGLGAWKRGLIIHAKGNVKAQSTFWVSGGSSAFRKSVWNKLGGLDPLFDPFYWEDIDLSYRAVKSGYEIIFEPKSVVIHEHETGAIRSKFTKGEIASIAYRNQLIFIWKNITDTHYLFQHFVWLFVHLLLAMVRLDVSFIKGFFAAAGKIKGVIRSRNLAKRYFVLNDSAVIAKASI